MQFSKLWLLILSASFVASPLVGMDTPEARANSAAATNLNHTASSSSASSNRSDGCDDEDQTFYNQSSAGTNRLLLSITVATDRIATSLEKLTESKPDDRPEYRPNPIPVVSKELQDALIANCPLPLHKVISNVEFAQKDTTARDVREYLLSDIPNLILFVGPPGVGKTSTGVAIAGHLGWRLAFKEAGALCNKYKNSGIEGIDTLFKHALTTNDPHVIILDELKGLTDKHNNKGDFDANVVEYLWQTFDKCKGKRIFVIATTNDASKIPAALQSRFSRDYTFQIPLPNNELKLLTLTVCLPKAVKTDSMEISCSVDEAQKKKLVSKTKNFSQRDIVGVVAKAKKAAENRAVQECKENTSAKFVVVITFDDLNSEIEAKLPGYRAVWCSRITTAWPYILQGLRIGYTCLNVYLQIHGYQMQLAALEQNKDAREEAKNNFNQQITNTEKYHMEQMEMTRRHHAENQQAQLEQTYLSLLLAEIAQIREYNLAQAARLIDIGINPHNSNVQNGANARLNAHANAQIMPESLIYKSKVLAQMFRDEQQKHSQQ